jgi:hypothetical protein
VDLLSSGPRRPPEPRGRPWLARARRLWRHRATRVGAVVLAAAAALTLLQLTGHPQRRPASAPTPTAAAAPSFDRLPGRTPIPAPAQTADRLSGPLPATGDPGRASATRAANLVLGRYCAEPGRYGLTVEPYTDGRSIDFRRLTVVVVDRVLTDSGTEMLLSLVWEGLAYRWFGPLSLVNGC